MGRVFVFFFLLFVGFGTGKEARMFSINSAREGTSQAVNLYPHSSFTAQHLVTAAPKRNQKKNSRNEDEPNRPVYEV